MLIKSILMVLITILVSGCVYYIQSNQQVNEYRNNSYPEQVLINKHQSTPTPTPTPTEIYGDLMIDNISRDLSSFYKRGWRDLYVSNEFDCSRMTTYMWDYIRTKYRIAPEIILAPNRKHAWLAIRVTDAGDTDRYLQWTGKGVKYYYIEATAPQVVKYEKDYYMGSPPIKYESSKDFYTTEIYMTDDPVDANTIAGGWFNEFRLTKPDLDKLNSFKVSAQIQ